MGVGSSHLYEYNGLKLLNQIGQGGYAKVYKAEWKGEIVAAKQLLEDVYYQVELTEKFYDECRILRKLDHRNIVKMIDLHEPGGEIPPFLITELMNSELAEHIHKRRIPLLDVLNLMLDVAEGLHYLHNSSPPIAHRDLSSRNILMTKDGRAKIADLGLAKYFVRKAFTTPSPGAPLYAAPETFCHNPVYDMRVDVFSFGVLLLEVINGHYPKPVPLMSPVTQSGELTPEHERRRNDLMEMGAEHRLAGLVRQCLENDREARPTISEIIDKLNEEKKKLKRSCTNNPAPLIRSITNGRTSILSRRLVIAIILISFYLILFVFLIHF